jgi:hypothetical protein
VSLVEACEKEKGVYECRIEDLTKIKQTKENNIKILKMSKKNGNGTEIRIILLPDNIFPHNVEDPAMKIVKAQLSQMINYIKTNPSKKYESINKLLPKRFPTTTAIA